MLETALGLPGDTTFVSSIKIFTVLFGAASCALSFALFMHFIASRKPIGKAVGMMLFGEFFCGIATVVFSITHNGMLDIGGDVSSILLRLSMFSVASATSLHLAYQTWKIETGQD